MKSSFILSLGLLAAGPAWSAPVSGCTDFSGDWQGTCQVGGVSVTDEETVTQEGCQALRLKNLTVPLGGTFALIETFPAGTDGKAPYVNNAITTAWDASLQSLVLTETVNNRDRGGLTGDVPTIITGDMKKADGKLVVDLREGGQTVISCTYSAK